ncbi:DegT/DnrJ/EryC1/StrS family aminotransferase [Leptospira gomenensis]|uniref:GDP-perosamine synthase n=1 Tax=Leptospira gomenensis TaxID=2484974 RepID=A0A5F1YRV1_9LEPT|nr:DegT/DnrJ/EryC1/StrS family aminotransferase [Leptospira gomenensis]TGK30910.1 DegT/DnrJ/EryC1/StrS family aminotransferase [Leptospira gomenensis]TGK32548.1 DegT/DnrJ/EryC1/StrS family aminotransferase [Leptospira gomenensis]TGK45370.1 DegT/DnrJ/EryC1/StrS family aminotransferase [Leptospira gomenensis]TGK60638.1 DegT/DnrJ/EryC1/StrS family aminotransferase [Leptospira gomenensis]
MKHEEFIPVCEPLLGGNELKYVSDAVSSGWISSSGKYVQEFEKSFADYCGVKYGVGVCNGTVALHLALQALGVGPGDEVIIPSFTMIATAFAVCYTGAMPVFVDVEPDTWNLDPNLFRKKITKKTKAVIPVHIMGLLCDMDPILNIAAEHGIKVIEDAAEAHGAEYGGKKSGSFSDVSCFSFFANKNLTTGEGGMCLTDDSDIYDRLRYLKNLSFPLVAAREYLHEDIGFNYRLSNLHAAIGLAQVEKADEYIALRKHNNSLYRRNLEGHPGIGFQKDSDSKFTHVHWMNAILVGDERKKLRDGLMTHLKENGVDSRKLFTGMHRQPSLKKFGCDVGGTYPVTDSISERGLYLPSSSSLKDEQISRISRLVRDYISVN